MNFVVELLRFLGANYAYVLAGMLSVVFVAAAYFAKHSLGIASFAYVVTRVRVMSGRMLKQNKLKELAESNAVSDVIAAFEGTAYEQHVAGKESIEEIEHGLAMSLAEDYQKIRKMSPKRAQPIFNLMSARYDIENIKKILAAKITNEPVQALMPGTMSQAFLQRLSDAETLEEALELLKSSHYGKIIKELPSDAGIEKIERSLEKYLYGELLSADNIEKTAKRAGIMRDSLYLKEIFGMQNDIRNIKIIIRLISEGVEEKTIQSFIIGSGFYLTKKSLAMLSDAKDLQSVINALQGTPYYSVMNDAMRAYSKEKSLYVFERALEELYVARIRSIALKQPFGLTPLVCYLLLKEHEISSIKMILNCIKEGLPKERIKELFIGA